MTEKRRTKTVMPGKHDKVILTTMTPQKESAATVPMQDLLGEKLRAYYDEVAREPVPDRFEKLLKELEARSAPKKSG
jgi:Anti-sigma factor NepR